jgi:uncharacterized protein YjbI with pentapeptide repeats
MAKKNFRDRSYRKKNLAGHNFRGADIRGCDFSGAYLVGADFSAAKAGLSPRQIALLGLLTAGIVLFVGDAMSRFVFNTIGQPPFDRNAPHVGVLYLILNLTTISSAISAMFRTSKLDRVLIVVTAILCGALIGFAVGFFYPSGLQYLLTPWLQQNPMSMLSQLNDLLGSAVARKSNIGAQGAIVGAILTLFFSRYRRRSSYKIIVSITSCIVSYAATFLWAAIAGAYFTASNGLLGILFAIVALVYLRFTTLSFFRIGKELTVAAGTSFRGADLSYAKFDYADLRNTDFSNTIGYIVSEEVVSEALPERPKFPQPPEFPDLN